MTLHNAIREADGKVNNRQSGERKIEWLNEAEYMVAEQQRLNGIVPGFCGYDADFPADTVLRAPEPWSALYPAYLEARLHYENGEYDRYNNAMAIYNRYFREYAAYLLRNHTPAANAWTL